MKFALATMMSATALMLMTVSAPRASAEASRVRWEIATVTCQPGGSYPCTLDPGGSATAMAVDCSISGVPFGCSTITMTGKGTFVAPNLRGHSRDVTGGGTWKVVAADGTTTSGTFVVTGLVQWEKSEPLVVPQCTDPICETTDNIGDVREATGGLAVLTVAYSDGTTGVVTLACTGLPDPFSITEGVIASKAVELDNVAIAGVNVPPLPSSFPISKVLLPVLFWNPGVFTNFVEFHISDRDEGRD